jgi:hypothetical protein
MHIHSTSGPDGSTSMPTIGDARHGWGLSIDQLHQLLQAEPAKWSYNDAAPLNEDNYVVIYLNTTYGYFQSWQYDPAGIMYKVGLIIPPDRQWLVDAFLVGGQLSEERYLFTEEVSSPLHTATVVSVYEDEVDGSSILNVQYQAMRWSEDGWIVSRPPLVPVEQEDLVPPTITQARRGWGLSPDELDRLMAADKAWDAFEPVYQEDGGHSIMYRHRANDYCQCWDYDAQGMMNQVRFLIPPDEQWLIGAFLVGATAVGDDTYLYLQEATKHPGKDRLCMRQLNSETMTQLIIGFMPEGMAW